MSEDAVVREQRAPWHLWVIGIVVLLWDLMGAFDYFATQTQNESYMSQFTPEQLEFFYGFPAWVVATWAIAVWGGLLGAVFLLLRRKWAEPVLLVSLVAMVITSFHNFVLADGWEMMGGVVPLLFTLVIFLVAVGVWLYARAMVQRGVLR